MIDLTLANVSDMLVINKNQLDQELVSQASVFDRICDATTEAKSLRDQVKIDLDNEVTRLSLEIRKKAEEQGDKVTEGKVLVVIQSKESYKELVQRHLELKKDAELWDNKKQSFLQRASMLKDLCSIYLSGYYQTESIKGTTDTKNVVYKGSRRRLIESGEN